MVLVRLHDPTLGDTDEESYLSRNDSAHGALVPRPSVHHTW
jgi:hypothetical protein